MKREFEKRFWINSTECVIKETLGSLFAPILTLVIIALLCSPVSSADTERNMGTSVTIIDDWGREVTLDRPAERIAFSHTAAGEGILLAGGWDKVIGRDSSLTDSRFYPNLDSIPAINTQNQPFSLDFERITQLKPDLVILQKYYSQREGFEEIAKNLEPDIPVVGLDFLEPENAESIRKLGVLIGTEQIANDYVKFHDGVINNLKEKTESLSPDEKPKVFIKGGTVEKINTFGRDASFWNRMCSLAGGKNIADHLPGDNQEVDLEWLTQQEIDIIIGSVSNRNYPDYSDSFGYLATDTFHASDKAEKIIADIKDNEVFSYSNAVLKDRVYLLEGTMITNPKAFIGTAYLAKWIHPDLFSDLNPEQIHQEYLTRFIGTDYDLKNTGIFGYPNDTL